jgi:signal transduction histidine kinase
MGEMIGNIAHQWRQPLSVISTGATGMLMQKQLAELSDETFEKTCNMINENTQYLSKTIDDFRNFIKGDRVKEKFTIERSINHLLNLMDGSIKHHNLTVIVDVDSTIEIDSYENELTQCLMNIFNNAKDVLKENNKDKLRLIFIRVKRKENFAIIKVRDNGGGIPADILPKIFEPYFTTKHKSQGTGLGLNMTYNLIVSGLKGTIDAKTVKFKYQGEMYKGAEFKITLKI